VYQAPLGRALKKKSTSSDQPKQEAALASTHSEYRRLPRVALPLILTFVATLALLWPTSTHAQDANNPETTQVVVKLNSTANCQAKIADVNDQYRTTTLDRLLSNVACIYLLRVPQGETAQSVTEAMQDDPRLLYAEPNFATDAPEGDPRAKAWGGDADPVPSTDPAPYSHQYAIDALDLPEAHSLSRGGGAVVAVLDTGVQLDHPELADTLAGSLISGYDFIEEGTLPADEPNGADDDGDGQIDEQTGHGTHVTGIVHLTAPEAGIMPLRVLDSDGTGNIFVIAEAVQYAVRNGADVVNLSLGSDRESNLLGDVTNDLAGEDTGDGEGGEAEEDAEAIEGVPPEGVVVVGAAGNTNSEAPRYPAAESPALAVASLDQQEKKSEFSNYGGWVDISAPGDEIYSLFPTSRYATWEGTSMATPFVAGQATLVRSMRPNMPAVAPAGQQSVESVIKNTARSLDAKNPNYSGKLGAGHADVGAALLLTD